MLSSPQRRFTSPSSTPARVIVRSDEAVISQWLLDQSTQVRRPAGSRRSRSAVNRPLRSRQAAQRA
jgi:hypothetical protein